MNALPLSLCPSLPPSLPLSAGVLCAPGPTTAPTPPPRCRKPPFLSPSAARPTRPPSRPTPTPRLRRARRLRRRVTARPARLGARCGPHRDAWPDLGPGPRLSRPDDSLPHQARPGPARLASGAGPSGAGSWPRARWGDRVVARQRMPRIGAWRTVSRAGSRDQWRAAVMRLHSQSLS